MIEFSSPHGRKLFREALDAGYMEGFFPLIEQFHMQSEPAFCGPGCLVMVLNALALDPKRLWKNPWRWFTEDAFSCCVPLDDILKRGMLMEEFADVAQKNGADVRMVRANECSIDQFRNDLEEATKTGTVHMALNFSRKHLQQTGDGHYSTVGGLHPSEDLALILDTSRFKYPPWWAPVSALWESM